MRLQAIGETDEEGQVRVFFELNGQPRIVKRARSRRDGVSCRRGARRRTATSPYRRADAGRGLDDRREAGPAGEGGRLLLTIEAMKMETSLSAPRDGKISEVLVSPGQPVDAKDLLIVMT